MINKQGFNISSLKFSSINNIVDLNSWSHLYGFCWWHPQIGDNGNLNDRVMKKERWKKNSNKHHYWAHSNESLTYSNGKSGNPIEKNQFYWALNQRGSSNKAAQNNLKCNSNFTIPYCLFQILLFEPNLRTNCEISDDFEYFEPRVKPISNVEDTGDNYCRLDSDNNVITILFTLLYTAAAAACTALYYCYEWKEAPLCNKQCWPTHTVTLVFC